MDKLDLDLEYTYSHESSSIIISRSTEDTDTSAGLETSTSTTTTIHIELANVTTSSSSKFNSEPVISTMSQSQNCPLKTSDNDDDDDNKPLFSEDRLRRNDKVMRRMQYLTGMAAIGGFLFGYDTGKRREELVMAWLCIYRVTYYHITQSILVIFFRGYFWSDASHETGL